MKGGWVISQRMSYLKSYWRDVDLLVQIETTLERLVSYGNERSALKCGLSGERSAAIGRALYVGQRVMEKKDRDV